MTPSAANLRVLYLEDNPVDAYLTREAIARLAPELRLEAVTTLGAALELLASTAPPFDIVLTDLFLPDGSGLDLLAHVRERELPLAVVIITASGDQEEAVAALKAGADDYLVKNAERIHNLPRALATAYARYQTRRERQSRFLRVLYAEPNAFDADLTRRFFAQQAPHIRVEVVGSGDEVLARMPQSPESPPAYDVLLLDYRLPGLNALEVVKALRLEGARQIPIVLVTGQGNEEVAVQALRLGVDEYLVKREGYLQRLSVVLENVQKQAELNQAEARYRNLFASMRDAIIIADNSRTIIDANQPALRTLFGYETEEILGQSTAMLYADPDQFELLGREVFHHQAAETGKLLETRFRRKSGDVFHGEVSALQLRDDKGIRVGNIGVIRDITERKCHEEQLKHLATHDELTGLANRALLLDRLEQSLHYARRSGRLVAVLLLDLDRFKVINDSLGHGFGDTLLGAVAQRLRQMVREADTVARLGGDEFVILLAEVAEVDDVGLVAAKILRLLAEPHRLDEREITLTASLGVSLFPRDSDDGATLIRNADMAMYRAKRDGRSAFAFYSPEMNRRIRETLELEGALRQALERDEFRLHYQPKVGLASGRVIGCEALVRWHHPQRGMVSPADFIPLAEETGLIVPLGTWVLQEACRQARVWQDAGLPALNIAVNLSARQFRKGNLPQLVEEFLRQAGLDPRLLELELTESMVMDDPVGAQRTMHALKELGVGLSLDDFGTGYSSLNYLRRFPVDSLKIDRSFIRDVASDPSGASVVTSVIDIAHNLGLTAVAEGVETREQLVFLAGCGCDMLQGFLFSKPLPAEEFADLLREGRRLTVAK
jgi:diguanylate cyclase (GGDEF)-like protein/PAS domain S-box-containing protein